MADKVELYKDDLVQALIAVYEIAVKEAFYAATRPDRAKDDFELVWRPLFEHILAHSVEEDTLSGLLSTLRSRMPSLTDLIGDVPDHPLHNGADPTFEPSTSPTGAEHKHERDLEDWFRSLGATEEQIRKSAELADVLFPPDDPETPTPAADEHADVR